MSKAIASNVTDLAVSGMSLDNLDLLRVKEIVKRHASTKTGGFNFQAGVLFTKVCKEIKSLCSIGDKTRLPDNFAKAIMSEIEALPMMAIKDLKEQGYNLTRQSGSKVRVNFRDMQITRNVTQSYNRIGALEEQVKDLHWEKVTCETALGKLQAMQPKDLEQRQAIEAKIAILEEKILKYTRLEKILTMELKEQEALVEKSS